jgi:hypothetical protein
MQRCSIVTVEEVVSFLERTDHIVLTTPETEDCGFTWTCYTRKSDGHTYFTIVKANNECIVDYDDIDIG